MYNGRRNQQPPNTWSTARLRQTQQRMEWRIKQMSPAPSPPSSPPLPQTDTVSSQPIISEALFKPAPSVPATKPIDVPSINPISKEVCLEKLNNYLRGRLFGLISATRTRGHVAEVQAFVERIDSIPEDSLSVEVVKLFRQELTKGVNTNGLFMTTMKELLGEEVAKKVSDEPEAPKPSLLAP